MPLKSVTRRPQSQELLFVTVTFDKGAFIDSDHTD